MVDIALSKNNVGQIINAITTVVSAEVESLRIKFANNKMELWAVDKNLDIDVFGSFPVENVNEEQKFSLPIMRFKALVAKQSQIQFEFKRGTLKFNYGGKVSGSVATEECQQSWTFPKVNSDAYVFNGLLLKSSQTVKLMKREGADEQNLFVWYLRKKKELYLASADNFNVAAVCIGNIELWEHDWSTIVPYKYIEHARKFAGLAQDNKIYLSNKEKDFFLSTRYVSMQLPSYSVDQTHINQETIIQHVTNMEKEKGIKFDLNDIKGFLSSSLSLKESDRATSILIKVKNSSVVYTIETKHGSSKFKDDCKTKIEFEARVGCAALQDLLSKISDDSECEYKVVGNVFCVTAKNGDTYLNLSTYQTEE